MVPSLSSNITALANLLNEHLKKKKKNISCYCLHFTNLNFRAKFSSLSFHTWTNQLHIWNPSPTLNVNYQYVFSRLQKLRSKVKCLQKSKIVVVANLMVGFVGFHVAQTKKKGITKSIGDLKKLFFLCQNMAYFEDAKLNFSNIFCCLPTTLGMTGELWMSRIFWHPDIRITHCQSSARSFVFKQ